MKVFSSTYEHHYLNIYVSNIPQSINPLAPGVH